jgi:SAM-dependent methyltransferase
MQPDWPSWTCPIHRALLDETDGELQCPRGHAYHRVQGIPRFVEGSTYSDAFGLQWKRHRRTQLDSFTGTTLSRDRAQRCLGSALFDQLEGLDVLECGCGAGRFTEVLLAQGARVTSVDLSDAVEANQQSFPQDDRHRIAQADIRSLPFEPRSFNVVFCLGVVQHTPVPEETIAALYDQVRPGGELVLDHYSNRIRWLLSTAPAFRAVLRRTSPERGQREIDRLVSALLPLHRRARGFAGTALRRVSPVQSYYEKIPQLSDDAQRDWALLDTHDALTDRYKHFRTPAQVAGCLRGLGLVDIHVGLGGNGVEARGRRPAAP